MKKAAAIGTFDGVHIGHLSVLKVLTEYAKKNKLKPVAITFRNHPLSVISPKKTPLELTPLWKKKKLLIDAGVEPIVLQFDEKMRHTTAGEWMRRLKDKYEVEALVIGYDNTFGSDGINMTLGDYKKLGDNIGIKVLTAQEVRGVSSSAIRKAVAAGDLESAHEMLGRLFSINAKVESGNRIGRTIDFPTANIPIPEGRSVPKPGVYAAVVKIQEDDRNYPAMVNIGSRPTVTKGDQPVIEAHLIDWNGDLYGKEITVMFLKRLRDEKRFESIQELKQRLSQDKEEVMEMMQLIPIFEKVVLTKTEK